jgi:hypothetical protein
VLGDVNGDELTDVAIGAPGEQENRGAVYIFHGVSGLDIGLVHSQVRPSLFPVTMKNSLSFSTFLTAT